ncbi:MAG: DUF4160 domain-containing protein [Caldilineaceae bacterium]|nr:DUF4160 domain-containing protein [Caldilineaceae bacterium]
MPEISRFYGIIIRMRYNDHPPPHFHACYGDQEVTVEIASGRVSGTMSRPALNLIWAWLDEHRDELMAEWERARAQEPLQRITPLD